MSALCSELTPSRTAPDTQQMFKSFRFLAFVAFALLCHAATAKTPFPEFTGQRLYVSGVPDVYQPLLAQIERLEKDSPQTYYVVVVESSGSGQFPRRDFLDDLHQAWLAQAARQGLSIDPNRAVFILLALKNRQLSVKSGTLLQSQYGLRDQVLDRQLVQPHFIPHAKAGNYLAGLQTLLKELDKTIAAKDAQVERAKQEAIARTKELERNARATFESANQLADEVRTELAAKKAAGMELASLEGRFSQAAVRLEKLDATTEPAAHVLQEASAAQSQLQDVRSALLQLAARQKQGEELLNGTEANAQQLQQTIAEHRRKDLATEAVAVRLEESWKQLESARGTLSSQPDMAVALAQTATQQLAVIKSELDQLPQLAQLTKSRLASLSNRREGLEHQLARAQQIGANTQAATAEVRKFDQELAEARELSQSDYAQALASFDKLDAALSLQQQQVATAYEQRYFLTRTAPVSAVSLTVLLIAAVVGGLWWRHTRMKRHTAERLAAFRSEVTQWMERLDGLKQRHQYLPFTDEDFTAPMTGQTLALYNEVQASYDRLRTLWLALMDRRTKAEGAFDLEKPFGVARLKEVAALLAGREDTTQLQPAFRECVEKLDRLNQAHEEAEKLQQQVQTAQTTLAEQIKQLAAAELPTEPLELQIAREQEATQQGVAVLRSDPLGARSTFEDVLKRLNGLKAVCQRRLKCVSQWRSVQQRIEEVSQRLVTLRASGLKLIEESANPDPALDEAHRQLADGWAKLKQADDAAAEMLVKQAHDRAAAAHECIERHLADKEFSSQQLPRLRGELATLRQRLAQAQSQQNELADHFHPDSWSLVADHVPRAGTSIEALAGSLDDAAQAAVEQTQHYSLAAQRLREAETQRQHAAALIDAVGQSLAALERQRADAAKRRQDTADSARRVAAYFSQHQRIVGAESQRTWSQARTAIEQAEAGAQQSRPHWPQVVAALDQAFRLLAAALASAEGDVRSHEQLIAELSQVRSRAANVGQLLRSNTADRPRANQRYQGAQQAIEQIAQASSRPNAAWSALVEQLKQASADVAQARHWAEEDIRLAEQAAAALRSAESEFQRSRTFVSFGVSAQMGQAESQLTQARQRLQSQDYEQSITLADSAERAARQAHLKAVREAEERRQRQEEEQRRQEMQRLAASAASSQAAASMFSPGSSSSSSTTSSSSWSSGTSQSSW